MKIKLFKNSVWGVGAVVLLTACWNNKHLSGTGEDWRRVEFSDLLADTTVSADSLIREMCSVHKVHAADLMPKEGMAYIERESGDRYIVDLNRQTDSTGFGMACYQEGSGSNTKLLTAMRPRGHGLFVLDEVGGHQWKLSGGKGLLYVYEGQDRIDVYDGMYRRTFVAAGKLDATTTTPPADSGGTLGVARSAWVKDADGRLVYVDCSGHVMKDNWTHDGYYADGMGHFDPYTPSLAKDLVVDGFYTWGNWGSWEGKQITFTMTSAKEGTAVCSIRMVKNQEVLEEFTVTATGHSTYRMVKKDAPDVQYHIAVTDEGIPGKGRQLHLSGYGETVVYF